MPMTIVITNAVRERKYRGLLASCMLEIAPGVYSHPRMNRGVRERLWNILVKWHDERPDDGSILMCWEDRTAPGGQGILALGLPQRTIIDHDGVLLSRLTDREYRDEQEALEER